MAVTVEAARLTEAHRIGQARLGARTVAQLATAWALLDPADLDATVERWLLTASRLIQAQRTASAQLAANYLTTFRRLELGRPGTLQLVLAERLDAQQALTSLTVTGPVRVKLATARGVSLAEASDLGLAGSSRAGMRLALNGGRDTIRDSAQGDRRRTGWERSLSGDPCDFCQGLADDAAAGDDSAAFVTHDGCGCQPVPVFA
jgi:hypothetical protein